MTLTRPPGRAVARRIHRCLRNAGQVRPLVSAIPHSNVAEGHKVERGRGTGGNMIVISYESGRVGRYMHLLPRNRQGVVVQRDDEVVAGQLIGACNDTGRSRGPHLHYDLKVVDGDFVDPVKGHDCE